MRADKDVNLNEYIRRVEEVVKDKGDIHITITSTATKEMRENRRDTETPGIFIGIDLYQDPEDFDFSKTDGMYVSDKEVNLRYDEDGIEYHTSFPVNELPEYYPKLSETGVAGELKKYASEKNAGLEASIKYNKEELREKEKEYEEFKQLFREMEEE